MIGGATDGEQYDREREEHARDLLRSWADAASNAGCPPSFVARMRTFADMHDRHAAEAAPVASQADGEHVCPDCRVERADYELWALRVCQANPCTCPKPVAGPTAITDETRKLRRIRQLAEQWAALTHWDYKGSPKVAEARAESANDAARILLNVLDGGDLL